MVPVVMTQGEGHAIQICPSVDGCRRYMVFERGCRRRHSLRFSTLGFTGGAGGASSAEIPVQVYQSQANSLEKSYIYYKIN